MYDFSHWMDIFATIIQSNPKKNFYLKSLCKRVLTIIFRDFLGYSKQCGRSKKWSVSMLFKEHHTEQAERGNPPP